MSMLVYDPFHEGFTHYGEMRQIAEYHVGDLIFACYSKVPVSSTRKNQFILGIVLLFV